MEWGLAGKAGEDAHLQTAPKASGHTAGWPRHSSHRNVAQVQPVQPGAQVSLCPLLPIVEGQDGMARAPAGSERQLCMVPVAVIGPAWLQAERGGLEARALHTQHDMARPQLGEGGNTGGSSDHLDQLFSSPRSPFLDGKTHPAARLRPEDKVLFPSGPTDGSSDPPN